MISARYVRIYAARGVPIDEIPGAVLHNMRMRMERVPERFRHLIYPDFQSSEKLLEEKGPQAARSILEDLYFPSDLKIKEAEKKYLDIVASINRYMFAEGEFGKLYIASKGLLHSNHQS